MICRIEDLKEVSTILLSAVDTSDISRMTENLELKVENSNLILSVTNGEYYVETKIPIFDNISFHATVNAELLLKLISKTTTETVEFITDDKSLTVVGNGTYKIPLIYDDDQILEIPKIIVENPTTQFNIKSEILKSVLLYNSKELKKGIVSNPVQKLYYIDNEGAITFTSGACVNKFDLEQPIKILLSQKVVSLFKLFKEGDVAFTLGHTDVNGTIQTRVSFEIPNLTITAILPLEASLVSSVPVAAIRDMALNTYPYSVTLNRNELLQAIERMLLFIPKSLKAFCTFEFGDSTLKITNIDATNTETVNYSNTITITDAYSTMLDLLDLKATLESYTDSHISVGFGNNKSLVLKKPNIYTVIPEVTL